MTGRAICAITAVFLFAAGCGPTESPPAPPGPAAAATAPSRPPPGRHAAEPLSELPAKPTLADYLAYAALHNAGLAAAFDHWKAALEGVAQAKALPDPRFTYQYFIREVETRVGPQRQSFALSQTFPWLGKLELQGSAAAQSAAAARQHFEAARLKLFSQVKDAYYEYYFLWRAIAVAEENVRLLKLLEGVAQAKYRAAAARYSDLIRAQVELAKLDDRLRTLRDLRGPVMARLNTALNRPAAAPLPWPTAAAEEDISLGDEQLLAWLAKNNPELKAMDFEIARRKLQIDLARKDYFPDVTLGATYIDTSHAIGGMHPMEDGKDPVIAMVSVNLPVWWDKLAAGVRQARRSHLAAQQQKAERANSLSAELKMVVYRFRDAGRKIRLYRDTLLPKARQSYKAAEAAYRAGNVDFTDLIDAQRVLLEFELGYERALADRGRELGRLEMLVGREIPRAGRRERPDTDQEPAAGPSE